MKTCSSTHRNIVSVQSLTAICLTNKTLCCHNTILETCYCCENISSHCEHSHPLKHLNLCFPLQSVELTFFVLHLNSNYFLLQGKGIGIYIPLPADITGTDS